MKCDYRHFYCGTNVYGIGTSSILDYPTQIPASTRDTAPDVVVTMMDATGSQILYSTYIRNIRNN